MRIVINDHLGHAPQVQLSRALAARGHDVLHVYCSTLQSPKADLTRQPGDPTTLAIEGLPLVGEQPTSSFFTQRYREAKFGRTVANRALAFRPDVVMACNNPLDVQRPIQSACQGKSVPFVYWMQDFHALQIDGVLARRSAPISVTVGSYYHWLERTLLQRSDAVIVPADDYLGILAEHWGVYDRQCMVVRNWSSLEAIRPGTKHNPWAGAHGLTGKKVALYAGTLGSMENPELLIGLAQRLANRPDALVVIVAEGPGAQRLADTTAGGALPNLRLLPFQPYEIYGDVLASADVLLGSVRAEGGVLFVPSKVLSYHCAGRPTVLAAPWQNLAALHVRDSGGGTVVPPDDADGMSAAVLSYFRDPQLQERTGLQARRYAKQTFGIERIVPRFERLFERLRTGPARQRQQRPRPSAVTAGE